MSLASWALLASCWWGVGPAAGVAQTEAQWATIREQMVRQVIVGGGIRHQGVIESLRVTPRICL